MRVQPHDLAALRSRIAPFDTEGARDVYRKGDFSRSDRVIDLDKRYRWDLFWAANAGTWISTLDYDVNDTHIDTALKSIVPALGTVADMFTVVGTGSYDAATDTLRVSPTTGQPHCIANKGANGEPEVPLWECPCRECTKMDWEALGDDGRSDYGSLKAWRHASFPDFW